MAITLVSGAVVGAIQAIRSGGRSVEDATRWVAVAAIDDVVAQGVVYLDTLGIFIADDGGIPLALYAASPHLGEQLLYCASEGTFVGRHGEAFDRRGIRLRRPSPRNMDRFDVRVVDRAVEINVGVLYEGTAATSANPLPPNGPRCDAAGPPDRGAQPGFAREPEPV